MAKIKRNLWLKDWELPVGLSNYILFPCPFLTVRAYPMKWDLRTTYKLNSLNTLCY